MTLTPPINADVTETATGFYWFEEGILCSCSKPKPPKLSEEEAKEEAARFFAHFGKQKLCILIDGKHIQPNTREERIKASEMMPDLVKALAVIVHNPMGRIVVNLFVGLQKPSYPLKIFKPGEENEAKQWLKQYL